MSSTSYNAEDVLQLLEEDGSEFPDSVSSGKEGDEVYLSAFCFTFFN